MLMKPFPDLFGLCLVHPSVSSKLFASTAPATCTSRDEKMADHRQFSLIREASIEAKTSGEKGITARSIRKVTEVWPDSTSRMLLNG